MRVALVSAEVAPFAKTGGLGDVAAALGRYLHEAGHDARLFLPLYGRVDPSGATFVPVAFAQDVPLRLGARAFTFSVFTAKLPRTDLWVYFVACPALFGAPAIYTGGADEYLRFALLSHAVFASCQRMGWSPDIVHANDWHAALCPLYAKSVYSWDRLFQGTKSVLTIHNLAYQGVFPSSVVPELGLAGFERLLHRGDLATGRVGFLKTGILYADAVTAVSETYAREIQNPENGMGLDALLRARSDSVVGIVNGVDYDLWSPENDAHIPARFSAADMAGKAICRQRLLEETGLAPEPSEPVIGIVSRLTSQKGFELCFDVLPRVLRDHDVRVVALGAGASSYEDFFRRLAREFPRKAAFRNGYDDGLAHRIEAGADVFLMPSRFEPCGLNQMYSLRYGTIPVVRETGGLADTVRHFDRRSGEGTGFVFEHFTADGLAWAIGHALGTWRDRAAWARLVRNAMSQDFSWQRQIRKYVALYEALRRS